MLKRFVLAASLLVSAASAQSLADLLPAESFLALGTQNLNAHQDKLEPFIDEFERLELAEALSKVFATEVIIDETSESSEDTVYPAELEGLSITDLLGEEAWLSLSASRFNPLPAVSLAAKLSSEASTRFDGLIAEAITQADVETLDEGGISFYQQALELEDAPTQVLVFAKQDNTLLLTTNPDVMRGMLRQLNGSNDPSFSSSDAYSATLTRLGDANFMGYIDYAQLPSAVATYTQGLGFDKLVKRLTEALETAGVSGGVIRFTDNGLESESFQAVDSKGKDKELRNLLTLSTAADRSALTFYSEEALTFSTQQLDLAAWWSYLNGITESTPELGGSLNELLTTFVGLDLEESVFSWTGDQVTTITTGISDVAQPGIAAGNLLGEQVYVLEANNEDAALVGLEMLFQTAGSGIAAFANPSGEMESTQGLTQDLNGVSVTSYDITDGVSVSYAVIDQHVLIATSQEALATVLAAKDSPANPLLLTDVPEGASSIGLSDNKRSLEGSAEQIISQLQVTAGIGGASQLNFEAVDEASAKLELFVAFVAERFGNSVSYVEKSPQGVYGYGTTEVSW